MLVTIGLEQIEILAIIGVFEKERQEKQKILIDVEITYNAKKAIENDSVDDVIDYQQIEKVCLEVGKREFFLVETFAHTLLERICTLFPVLFVKVRVIKKPYEICAKSAFVVVERKM